MAIFDICDPTLIIPMIARVLDVTELPDCFVLDSQTDFLRDKQLLLLFDNFEKIVAIA